MVHPLRTMYRINLTTLSLVLVLGTGSLMSESTQHADGSMKGLYEYLLQREYASPVSYADHQIKRKAVRSPSLRLRFGRRSDPGMPVQPEDDDNSFESRSIRAPQLRLRFGRSDPALSDSEPAEEDTELTRVADKRKPLKILRFGRSGSDYSFDARSIRAPQLRLRFGRSDPMLFDAEPVEEDTELTGVAANKRKPLKILRFGRSGSDYSFDARSIRAPQLRLRFGRSDPMLFDEEPIEDDTEQSDPNSNQSLEQKRGPTGRLRFGRADETDANKDQNVERGPTGRLRFGRDDETHNSDETEPTSMNK